MTSLAGNSRKPFANKLGLFSPPENTSGSAYVVSPEEEESILGSLGTVIGGVGSAAKGAANTVTGALGGAANTVTGALGLKGGRRRRRSIHKKRTNRNKRRTNRNKRRSNRNKNRK